VGTAMRAPWPPLKLIPTKYRNFTNSALRGRARQISPTPRSLPASRHHRRREKDFDFINIDGWTPPPRLAAILRAGAFD